MVGRRGRMRAQGVLAGRGKGVAARGVPLAWHWVVAWVGFRGAALMIFAAAYMGIGVGVLGNPVVPAQLFHSQLPVWFRVALWIGTAVVAIAGATFDRPHWQSYGFAALFLAPGERMISYTLAMVGEPSLRWAAGSATYFLFCALVALIASWPEPATSPGPRPDPRRVKK